MVALRHGRSCTTPNGMSLSQGMQRSTSFFALRRFCCDASVRTAAAPAAKCPTCDSHIFHTYIRRVLRIPKLPPPSPAVLLDLDATVARGARLQQVPPSASLKPGNLAWYSALVAHHYQYRVVRLNGLAFALRDYDPQCDKWKKSCPGRVCF